MTDMTDTFGYEAEPSDVAAEISGLLDDITDPLEVYHRATAAQAHHEAVAAALTDERRRACAAMWDNGNGLSYARIADLIGTSRSRAQQLVERGRALPLAAETRRLGESYKKLSETSGRSAHSLDRVALAVTAAQDGVSEDPVEP